ncbi:MAG: ABC transporter ATP-binding protein [Pseudomonadota bacterium]
MTMLLKVSGIDFAYRGRKVLHDISLEFRRGEVVSLLGPNGSGKTTLLKVLLGLLTPRRGCVHFENRLLSSYASNELAKKIAYVPQTHREAFSYSVEDVVLMGRMPYHSFFSTYSTRDREIAEAAMDRLDILALKDRAYTEISGGERQLTLIARALAQGAGVFIMDEPVNGLDYGNQMRLLNDINGLAEEGLTFIMTTHFPDHALMTADRVILFKEGRVIADGAPEATITRETLQTLYRIDVNVVAMTGSGCTGRFCMPAWAM